MASGCAPVLERLDGPVDLLAIHRASPDDWPYLLASTASETELGRHSLLLFRQGEQLSATDPAGATRLLDRLSGLPELAAAGDAFSSSLGSLPFAGGWFIYLGYELAGAIEPSLDLPPAHDGLPMAFASRCPAALVIDHREGTVWLAAESERALEAARRALPNETPEGGDQALPELDLKADDGERFKRGVERIREWIRAGDVFQVNLSRAWQGLATRTIDPATLFAALANANPAPFAGLARLPGGTVVSSSPERLVQIDGRRVETRPIAGTRPRGHDASSDASLSAELMANAKERAEHIMLIDLERNDLGRVCRAGSVEVNELMVVESYAHVHHIVSNIRGELRADVGPAEVIRAVFPGGTITGCPKVRCMEIIAELEQVGRGCYTGSMGYLGHGGRMDLNILIRTLVVNDHSLSFRTGAGIVVDSDPAAELAETEAKARGLLRALKAGA